jgi:hypothetical protein
MKVTPKRFKIPQRYARFIEIEPDVLKDAVDATVAEWRTARRLAERGMRPSPVGANELLRLARILGFPDDLPLLPGLKAIADDDLKAFTSQVDGP